LRSSGGGVNHSPFRVAEVVGSPEQRFPQRRGLDIFPSRVVERDRTWLVRVIVDVDRDPAEVVTVYRTSSVTRYWRDLP
jgi:hypothetical protein